jgi:hypothetical protein
MHRRFIRKREDDKMKKDIAMIHAPIVGHGMEKRKEPCQKTVLYATIA